ncbi:MAG: M28 family peptidase [Bacteroidetes bacterium]|nr:MAG: M28 family peptidase [Bacteroidota bacterium]
MKYLLIAIIPVILASCNNPSRKSKGGVADSTAANRPKVEVPSFNKDSAYAFIVAQLAFGPRVPGTPAHEKCAEYITGKLKSWCGNVIIQKCRMRAFNGKVLEGKNIIASWKPELKNRILLCSHWESRPWADHDPDPKNRRKPVDAANDGASGTGILMEAARQFSLREPAIGIDIILFDLEDYGPPQDESVGEDKWWGLGSQYWAQNPHKQGYSARYGILLDMVGAPGATFLLEGFSQQYAADIQKKVWDAANRIGFSSYFLYEKGTYVTDDHLSIIKTMDIPVIDLIHLDKSTESGFYPYWHTTHDNLAAIDASTLKAVGQTLLTVAYEEQ